MSEQRIKVRIEDRPVIEVRRKAYVSAKTKQLREFGYSNLTEETVNDQLDAVLAGKQVGSGLTVIGEFMKDEIVT